MLRLIAARLAQSLVVIFGALIIAFALGVVAGNPASILANSVLGVAPGQIRLLEEQLGYGDPLPQRFARFIGGAVQGDFGASYRSGKSALALVLDALPNTIALVAVALTLAVALTVPLAVYTVLRRERLDDRVVRRGLVVAQGMPDFWIALLLVLIFSVDLGWFQSIGMTGPSSLVLPAVALAIPTVPALVRLVRGELLDVMKMEFITTVRAKGFGEREVVVRHGLRNALPALVTFLALQIGWLMGGTIIVESVFAWPGIGTLVLDAVQTRDLAVVQALVMVIAVMYVLLNLVADVLVGLLDPRVRVSGS